MEYENIYNDESLYRTMRAYRGRREVKVTLSICSMLVFIGLVLGVILYRITGESIDIDADSIISTYFKGMFAEADSLADKLFVIMSSFYHEILFPLLVFAMGYTVFAPIFCAAICVWKAAVCSFAICMLEFTTQNGIFIESLIYLASQIAIISVSVSVAIRALFYSKRFQNKGASLADIVKRNDSREYILDFVVSAGVLFVTITLTLVLINFI